ncbi:MAG: metal ABC transporter substrate-binding protein [Halovenus sp.]
MHPSSTPNRSGRSRRSVLAAAASAGVVGLAGCTGGGSSSRDVVASFFTFYDFARQITAETPITVENLVPVGLHGHGWDPDPTVTRDIIEADAFVHVGEDFQPWADRAIQTVRDDGAETHLVNSRAGVDLVDLADTAEEDEQVSDGKDPHFWLDPARAKVAVDNIETGLATVYPEQEGTFAANAETLRGELDELDEEWQAVFDAAERDVVFLAAHNAFEYIGQRYGASVRPLVTNLAATDDVRPADRRRAQETIAEYDIRYIGAAIFEPRRPAQRLLEDTAVEAYYPVTPYAGTREEWVDRGWGYFEIARQINLPTFEIVLGARTPTEAAMGEWRNFE